MNVAGVVLLLVLAGLRSNVRTDARCGKCGLPFDKSSADPPTAKAKGKGAN